MRCDMREASLWENRLYDRLSDVLDGFKEVQAQPRPQRRAVRDTRRGLAGGRQLQDSHSERNLSADGAAAELALHAARRRGVRRADVRDTMAAGSVTKSITALVFIVGACFGLVQSIPIIAAANAAADRLEQLEVRLQQIADLPDEMATEPAQAVRPRSRCATSNSATSTGCPTSPSRSARSISRCNSGDLVILTGGNGSGKSTFMKAAGRLL